MRRRRRSPFPEDDGLDLPEDPLDPFGFDPSDALDDLASLLRSRRDFRGLIEDPVRELRSQGRFELLVEMDRKVPRSVPASDLAWARFGLGRDPGAKAPRAVRTAEALLAGRDPAQLAAWHGNDGRRRTVQMAWELMDGDVEAASRRKGRALPPKDQGQDWWVGLAHAARGEVREALRSLDDAPAPLDPVTAALRGDSEPVGPAAPYAAALQAGGGPSAARAVVDGVAADMDSARIAAAAALAPIDRGAAQRHLATLPDPFLRALWRVRHSLVDPARGWMEVGLEATGWRAPAAPLAFLRAATAFRAAGLVKEARRAMALAGEGARLFPRERAEAEVADPATLLLLMARAAPAECEGWQAATLVSIRLHGWAAGVEVAREAHGHGCGCGWHILLAVLERGVEVRDPRVLPWLSEIRGLPLGSQALVVGLLGRVAPDRVPDALAAALDGLAPKAVPSMHRLVGRALPPAYWTDATVGEHARRFWFADPAILANTLDGLPARTLPRLSRYIRDEAPAEALVTLHVALAEGCLALGKAVPGPTLSRFMAGDPAHWDDYVLARIRNRRVLTHLAPPQAREAFAQDRYVFRKPGADLERMDRDFERLQTEARGFVPLLPEIERSLRDLPIPGLTASLRMGPGVLEERDRDRAVREARKARKKAEKKARKQGRRRR